MPFQRKVRHLSRYLKLVFYSTKQQVPFPISIWDNGHGCWHHARSISSIGSLVHLLLHCGREGNA